MILNSHLIMKFHQREYCNVDENQPEWMQAGYEFQFVTNDPRAFKHKLDLVLLGGGMSGR